MALGFGGLFWHGFLASFHVFLGGCSCVDADDYNYDYNYNLLLVGVSTI